MITFKRLATARLAALSASAMADSNDIVLDDASETANAVANMCKQSATDPLGLDQRARVMVRVENGAWIFQS
jgi:hypothetical protein